jgi:hypothetical protein
MGAHDLRDGRTPTLLEMSLPKKDAEADLRGIRRPLNEHVLKLLAFDMPDELRAYFRKEVRKWLRDIQTIRLKPHNKPGKAAWYYDLLYEGPFGGVEAGNVATICDGIDDYYEGRLVRNATPVPVLVERLRAFHEALAERAARGEPLAELAATL